jgi:hypothetical protein
VSKKKKHKSAVTVSATNNLKSCEVADALPKGNIGNLRKQRFLKPSSEVPQGIIDFFIYCL